MLEVKGINVFRGEAQILWDLDMKVEKGEVVTVLGANGAGKTTLVESILGIHHPKKGVITFLRQEITFKPSFLVTRMGMSCVPEGRRIFKDMTVYENLEMGAYPKKARLLLKETAPLGVFPLPYLEGEGAPDRRDPQRRGTTDARHRQGFDVKADAPSC